MSVIDRYPVPYIHNACFTNRAAVNKLMMPIRDYVIVPGRLPPLPNRQQERQLFLQMNYHKYRANQIRAHLTPSGEGNLRRHHRMIQQIRNIIWAANYRAVRKFMANSRDVNVNEARISDGCLTALRAIDGFDVDHNLKFSTYLTTALLREVSYRTALDVRQAHRYKQFVYDDDTRIRSHGPTSNNEVKERFVNRLLTSVKTSLGQKHHDVLCHTVGVQAPKLRQQELAEKYGIPIRKLKTIIDEAMNFLRTAGRYQIRLSEELELNV